MGLGILGRPGDKPSENEERAVTRSRTKAAILLNDVDWRLRRSTVRSIRYAKELRPSSTKDLQIERRNQDRMLDERIDLMKQLGLW